jgi:hypothetical protein
VDEGRQVTRGVSSPVGRGGPLTDPRLMLNGPSAQRQEGVSGGLHARDLVSLP